MENDLLLPEKCSFRVGQNKGEFFINPTHFTKPGVFIALSFRRGGKGNVLLRRIESVTMRFSLHVVMPSS